MQYRFFDAIVFFIIHSLFRSSIRDSDFSFWIQPILRNIRNYQKTKTVGNNPSRLFHVVFVGLDHFFYHLTAYGTCFFRS